MSGEPTPLVFIVCGFDLAARIQQTLACLEWRRADARCVVVDNANCVAADALIGSADTHVPPLIETAKKSGNIYVASSPDVLNRVGNDSFAHSSPIERASSDLIGYSKIYDLHFAGYPHQTRCSFMGLLSRESAMFTRGLRSAFRCWALSEAKDVVDYLSVRERGGISDRLISGIDHMRPFVTVIRRVYAHHRTPDSRRLA